MTAPRNSYEPAFKAEVGLTAIQGKKTLARLAADFAIHPSQVSAWKKQILLEAAKVFSKASRQAKAGASYPECQALRAAIAQQSAELDFLKRKIQSAGRTARELRELVEKDHPQLSQRRQCHWLGLARSSLTYQPVPERAENQTVKRLLDKLCQEDPSRGSRRLATILRRDHGLLVNRKRLLRLQREIGHRAT